ncbi:unnamed protein product [Brassica oleracea]
MPYSSHVFIDGFSRSSTICISDCRSQDSFLRMTLKGSKSIIATPHTVFFDDMVARILNQMLIGLQLLFIDEKFQDLLLTTSYTHFCDNFQDNKDAVVK